MSLIGNWTRDATEVSVNTKGFPTLSWRHPTYQTKQITTALCHCTKTVLSKCSSVRYSSVALFCLWVYYNYCFLLITSLWLVVITVRLLYILTSIPRYPVKFCWSKTTQCSPWALLANHYVLVPIVVLRYRHLFFLPWLRLSQHLNQFLNKFLH